ALGSIESLNAERALVEQAINVLRAKVLQPLEQALILGNAAPVAFVDLLVAALLEAHAVEAHRNLQKPVFGKVDEIAVRHVPALLQLLQGEIVLLDHRHSMDPTSRSCSLNVLSA